MTKQITTNRFTYKRWTKKELKFLMKHYEELSLNQIAKRLKRTTKSVRFKAQELGLKSNFEKLPIYNERSWWVSEYAVAYFMKNPLNHD